MKRFISAIVLAVIGVGSLIAGMIIKKKTS